MAKIKDLLITLKSASSDYPKEPTQADTDIKTLSTDIVLPSFSLSNPYSKTIASITEQTIATDAVHKTLNIEDESASVRIDFTPGSPFLGTGLFLRFRENISISENLSLQTAESGYLFGDAAALVDIIRFSFQKNFIDISTISDSLVFDFIKTITDTTSLSELISFIVQTEYIEDISLSENISIDVNLIFSELINITDSLISDTFLGYIGQESPAIVDTIQLLINLSLKDTINISDTVLKEAISERTNSESSSISDSVSLYLQVNFSENISITDNFIYQPTFQSISDLPAISEIIVFGISTNYIETSTINDSGLINMQDYTVYNYFLEDYAGTNYIF